MVHLKMESAFSLTEKQLFSCLCCISACLGSSPGSVPDSSFLSVQILEAVMVALVTGIFTTHGGDLD